MLLDLTSVQRKGADLCLVLSDRLVRTLDLREGDNVAVQLRLLLAGRPRARAPAHGSTIDPFRREEPVRETW